MSPQSKALEAALAEPVTKDPKGLENLAGSYPYFAPVQILLLQTLDPSTEAYRRQYQKALLYFNDPLQFEWMLNRERFATELDLEETGNEASVTQAGGIQESGTGAITEEETQVEEPKPEPEPVPVEASSVLSPAIISPFDTIDPMEEEDVSETGDADDTGFAEMTSVPADAGAENGLSVAEEQDEGSEKNEAPVVSFEPYYTVDYFASQGIKLNQEDQPKDKFGKQVKSFTDWLKTMKRLPQLETERIDASRESKVVHLADDSVQEAEIITESMAEVWLKQGNRQKAGEIYHKLSLLDPSKKAYFAAKIQNLNA